jgi:hypothetical protein
MDLCDASATAKQSPVASAMSRPAAALRGETGKKRIGKERKERKEQSTAKQPPQPRFSRVLFHVPLEGAETGRRERDAKDHNGFAGSARGSEAALVSFDDGVCWCRLSGCESEEWSRRETMRK